MPSKDNPNTEEQAYRPPEAGHSAEMQRLLNTLDRVFSTFREQLRDETPKAFTGNAKIAVDTFSDIVAGLRFETRPRPFRISGKALSPVAIELSWTDEAGKADGYRVERCLGNNCSDLDEVGRPASTDRFFIDSNLSPNTTYRYRVVAFNLRGESPSNITNVTTMSSYPAEK